MIIGDNMKYSEFEADEREKRIKEVAEYVIKTGASTRKTAEYFTEHHFPISNATVSEYCHLYKKRNPQEKENITKVIKNNTPQTIRNKKVEFRVYNHTKLLLSGLTIKEIAEYSHSSYWTIYNDLTMRLNKLDSSLAKQVKSILKSRSEANLKSSKRSK